MLRTAERSPLLLDTHIWLWEILAADELSLGTRLIINDAAADRRLRLSAMSIWEIAMLASRNRIDLPKPARAWVDEALLLSHVVVDPLNPAIAVESCELPGGFRPDPVDQIIVATARVTGATLMTRDQRILDYAAAGHVMAIVA